MKKNIFQKEAKKAFLIELEELKAFSKSKNFNVEELCTHISNCKGKIFIYLSRYFLKVGLDWSFISHFDSKNVSHLILSKQCRWCCHHSNLL